ncbi:MAG TPA: hypothetical protein VM370_05705, partial [Candidatus Thermoplasmatota archaeon]|nr:hypothetical protein [Candidatus Thermoplasmatota archaeon]
MPFLRDEGPPIPQASIQKLRETLPVDYGWQVVNETGREVLVVRVPKPKPDYLHDLAEVAFYVGLEQIRNTKDVLLIGHEKTARLEPQLLRDHIRAQGREDAGVVDHLRRQLDRQYGHTFVQSPSNHQHNAFAVRIPKETVAQFTADDVTAIRQLVANLRPRVMECQYALIVANGDHERLGRRTLMELIGDQPAPEPVVAPSPIPTPSPISSPSPAAAPRLAFPPVAPTAAAPAASAPASIFAAPAPVARQAPIPVVAAPIEAVPIATEPEAPPTVEAHETAVPRHGLSDTTVSEEYEIVSKPKPPAAPAAPVHAPQRLGLEGADIVHDEYEVVSSKKPSAPEPSPPASPLPEPSEAKHVLREDKEFEVFTSKPKPRAADSAPAITPPGMGGFQHALQGAAGPAPHRTKEYEIMGRTSVTSDPSIAQKMRLPSASGPAPAPSPIVAAAAPAAPVHHAPQRLGLEGADIVHDEYEVVTSKKTPAPEPSPPSSPSASPSSSPAPEPSEAKHVLREDKEFEVFTSKPKPRAADSAPAITPPGMGGFQHALQGA